MRLGNKVAVITGASSGMGRASAIMFAKEGAKVVVADINDAGGEETVSAIKSNGGEAVFVHTDVSKAADAENLINAALDKFGKIDILFNVAGIPQKPTWVEDIDESLWDRIFAVNVKGVFLTSKYAVPVMKKAKSGVIINVASMGGLRPKGRALAYGSSKGAVITLTKALALELAPERIRVNVINPALTDTPMLPGFFPEGEIEEYKKQFVAAMPLGRMVTPEDVAYAAVYVASDESSTITGGCINLDGGRGI